MHALHFQSDGSKDTAQPFRVHCYWQVFTQPFIRNRHVRLLLLIAAKIWKREEVRAGQCLHPVTDRVYIHASPHRSKENDIPGLQVMIIPESTFNHIK